MYRINNESLREAANQHRDNTGLDFSDEICLLKALIEDTCNESANATEALAKLHGPLATVVKSVEALHKIQIAQGFLLCQSAAQELGLKIVAIISDALAEIEDSARERIIDKIAAQIPAAIVDQANPDSDIKSVGHYNEN